MTNLGAEVAMPGEAGEWPVVIERTTTEVAPICGKCGSRVVFVGKLPAIRFLPLLQVDKCAQCNHVLTLPL